jgi:hypothetical protein
MRKDSFIVLNVTTVLLILLSGCSKSSLSRNSEHEHTVYHDLYANDASELILSDELRDIVMVVFVHGTMLPLPSFISLGQTIYTLMSRGYQLNKSIYQVYLDSLRQASVFQYQPVGGIGLESIKPAQQAPYEIATFYQQLDNVVNKRANKHYFYTFGWNGRLDRWHRQRAAYELYHALIKERDKLSRYASGRSIKIVVIGHSHGGNVVLNLVRAESVFNRHLKIDRALLLGTPIQQETASFARSSLFDKVYNLYSGGDNVQILDIFSTNGYSYRRFEHVHRLQNNHANVVQLEIKVGDRHPSHTELWFYGAPGNYLYRCHAEAHPYPIAAYSPAIISLLERHLGHLKDVRVRLTKKNGLITLSFYRPDVTYVNGKEFLKRYLLSLNNDNIRLEMGRVQRE